MKFATALEARLGSVIEAKVVKMDPGRSLKLIEKKIGETSSHAQSTEITLLFAFP